jgi:hypothetical protein
LKERCGLESHTNFFPFKKSPKTESGLDSGVDLIPEYTVYARPRIFLYMNNEVMLQRVTNIILLDISLMVHHAETLNP